MSRGSREDDSEMTSEVAEAQGQRKQGRDIPTALEPKERMATANPGPRNPKCQSPEHTGELQCPWHGGGVGLRETFDSF